MTITASESKICRRLRSPLANRDSALCSAPHLSSGYELSAVAGKVLLFDLTRCPIPEC
jgi:hypothetical protein